MNRIIKKIVIGLVIITILFLGFKFIVVSWLSFFSSPKKADSFSQERILFEKFKKEYNFKEINRTPELEKDFLESNDTLSYELYIRYIDCNKSNDFFKEISNKMATEINNKISLNDNFYKYKFIFYCKEDTYSSISNSSKIFTFLRDSLNK
ncbi:hypothetical protein EH230_13870 [Flavobacterium columnare]|uniref:Uncharacterized protein n=1 Tax=Flavobacterium columnare TaxID=996 RepID=A0A437U8A1_9FLAO|nr:hypothetical protein [Flavobacterium columnare]RVU89846.1 hypothetical protein EH230_13870 [Flavobacterium columnare]